MADAAGVPVTIGAGSNLRSGVSAAKNDNLLGALVNGGTFTAVAQCTGEQITNAKQATNNWWVKIEVPANTPNIPGHVTSGWVSAVEITVGGNNEPIPNVPLVPTTQA